MNLLISIIYAPIVIYLLNNFNIKTTAIYIAIFSFLWLLISLVKKQKKESFFPFLYLLICLLAYFLDNKFTLKLTPILISIIVGGFILYTYIVKNSFIFIFLKKLKIDIKEDEKEYIHKSTLFWFLFSIINSCFHAVVLYINNEKYWIFYSSIGWYFIFIFAGVIQYLHRKFFFLKVTR